MTAAEGGSLKVDSASHLLSRRFAVSCDAVRIRLSWSASSTSDATAERLEMPVSAHMFNHICDSSASSQATAIFEMNFARERALQTPR
jgi:hypothetical protein